MSKFYGVEDVAKYFESEKTQHIIALYQSRTLIVTSSLVVIPIYVAYNNGYYFYMITSFGTGLCSILYWYHPIHGWRRNLDLLYAFCYVFDSAKFRKYSFIVYFVSGLFFLQSGICNIVFYISSLSILKLYIMSISCPDKWFLYHVIFHILSIATMTHIILFLR